MVAMSPGGPLGGNQQRSGTAYTPLCPLATGGMAAVDVVARREGSFSRLYAMKRLLPHLRTDEQVRAMFLDEARYAGLIRHANVVSVLDVGEDDDGPYLVMDYIDGVALSDLLQLGEPVPMQIGLRIAQQTADGLHVAHELCDPGGARLGLVHRDVSPQNILVGFDGVVRVADFGIAKALGQSSRTATGVLKGKLGYLSPEQLRFEEPDRRSDLFSLGVVLHELLSGQRLYPSTRGMEAARRILREPPPDITDERPDTPAPVVELLFELLAKDPEHRPSSAQEVSRRINAVLGDLVADEGLLEIADEMEQRFGERRAERKAELAEHLQALSTTPTTTPTTEASPTPAGESTTRPIHRGRLSKVAVAGVVAAVVLAGGALLLSVMRSDSGPAAASPAAASVSGPVTIVVETEPAGATVHVAGTPRGVTPATVSLPRGAAQLPLRCVLSGYLDHQTTVVPDVDQRLRFSLTRAAPSATPPVRALTPRPHPPAPSKPKAGRDPRDFERFE